MHVRVAESRGIAPMQVLDRAIEHLHELDIQLEHEHEHVLGS
jgi:hypothetical protein